MSKKEKEVTTPRVNRGVVVLIYIGFGILTTLVLTGLKLAFEHSSYGHETELWVFGKLQGSLSPIDLDNPIVMLDISDLPGGKGQPTPRKQLKDIIEALADQHPLAIAVDVDFSPKPNRFATNDDPEFFDFCLDIRNKRKIPVFLAVGERKSAPPEAWLGQEEYKDLAVAVAADKYNTSKLPLWVQAKGSGEELKTMSYALALEYRKHLPDAPHWISWAVEKNVEGTYERRQREEAQQDDAVLTYADRLVNYSKLDAMKIAAQKDTSAEAVRNTGSLYKNRLVILGDVSKPLDNFPVPGRLLNEGGSLLHASATYTLIKEPLFEFKSGVRLLLDFLIAGFIIATVAIIRYRNPDNLSWRGKQALFIYLAIIGVIFAGWLLVRLSGVLWLDFGLVAFALFLHPTLERLIHKIWARRKKAEQPEQPPPATEDAGVKTAVCLLAATLIWASTAHAQDAGSRCQQRVAAVVLNLHLKEKKGKKGKKSTCYFRENKDAPWQELSAADAGQRQFRAGQHLCCDKGCSLVILLCGTREQYPVGENPPHWYPVVNAYSSPTWIDLYPEIPARTFFKPDNPDSSTAGERGGMQISEGLRYTQPDRAAVVALIGEKIAANTTASPSPTATPTPTPTASTAEAERTERTAAYGKEPTLSARERPASSANTKPTKNSDYRRSARTEAAERAERVESYEAAPSGDAKLGNRPPPIDRPTPQPSPQTAEAMGSKISGAASAPLTVEEKQRAAMMQRLLMETQFSSLLDMGNSKRNAKDYSGAEQSYTDALHLMPDDPRALYGIGNVYSDQGKWKEAEQSYRRALLLNSYYPAAYVALGFVLLQPREGVVNADRLAEGELYLWHAASLEPLNETAYDLLATVLEKRGAKVDEVERAYRRALALNPRSINANLRLSELLRGIGHRVEADKFLRKAETLAYRSSDLLTVAEVMESQRRYDRAERLLRRALAFDSKDARALYALGRVLMLRKRYDEAAMQFKLAAEVTPNGFAPRYLLGMTQLRAGNLAEAERAFDEAATKAPAGGDKLLAVAYSLASVGDAYETSKRFSDAVRLYEKALQYDPEDSETKDKLSEARRRLKR